MKHILLIISVFYTLAFSAGFTADTLVLMSKGQIPLQEIQKSHTIVAQNNNVQAIINLQTYVVDEVVCIQIADDYIVCGKDQLFWCVNKNRWQQASSLHHDDTVLTFDFHALAITNVTILQQETVLHAISVTNPQHLFVGKYMILAHNFAFVPAVAAGVTICFGAGIDIIAKFSAGIMFCGALIGCTWGKKNKERVTCTPTCSYGNNQVPLFNYADQEHPHGIYIDSPKHTSTKRGNISAKPKNGQKALDNSVQIKSSSPRRIGISEGEFVILNRTSERVYHGHVETWEEMDEEVQNILKEIGWVRGKGKIICKEK